MIRPAGAIGTLKGLYYKIGKFGRAYYWSTNGEWVRSERKAPEIEALIIKMDDAYSLDDAPPKKVKPPKVNLSILTG